MAKTKTIITGSDNIFLELGFPPEEASVLAMRSQLMVDVGKALKAKKWTQAKAAEMLGISQPRISDLLRGKWDKFGLETLVTLAAKLGIGYRLRKAA